MMGDHVLHLFGKAEKRGGPLRPITSFESWRDYGGPKDPEGQWVEFRSAYELAQAWCGDGSTIAAPQDFLALLQTHPLLDGLELLEGYAEHETPLRGERGGPRNHDLLLVGRTPSGVVVIGVEGKADETFDKPLAKRWEEAQATLRRGEATAWPKRLERLAAALLGVEATAPDRTLNPAIAQVPYQLLSALAGTLIEAEEREAQLAVFVAHTFRTSLTADDLIAANDHALADFIGRFSNQPPTEIKKERLYGPFLAHDSPTSRIPSSIPFLIGGITTDRR